MLEDPRLSINKVRVPRRDDYENRPVLSATIHPDLKRTLVAMSERTGLSISQVTDEVLCAGLIEMQELWGGGEAHCHRPSIHKVVRGIYIRKGKRPWRYVSIHLSFSCHFTSPSPPSVDPWYPCELQWGRSEDVGITNEDTGFWDIYLWYQSNKVAIKINFIKTW